MNDDVFSLESNEDKTENEDSEEKRRERLEKIEKRLGRYDKAKEIRHKKNNILMKYFLIATNMIYILAGPIILMLGAYLLLEKFVFKKQQPIVLIIFLILGAFTGYWSLIKQVRDIK
ncbi:MAG: AtpZ/AtpI family protein [Leptotrichia sp.]|nr:AtpZ/AtpI family protein [Leptotrichia sp.]